jgi:hypothetical protein
MLSSVLDVSESRTTGMTRLEVRILIEEAHICPCSARKAFVGWDLLLTAGQHQLRHGGGRHGVVWKSRSSVSSLEPHGGLLPLASRLK